MGIKAVLFDFGGVIVNECISFLEYGDLFLKKFRKKGVEIDIENLGQWLEKKFEEIYHSAIERRLEDLVYEYLLAMGKEIDKELIKEVMEEIISIDYCKLNEEAVDAIKKLREMGYKLCIVSNWLEEFPRKFLKRKGLDKYFDCIIISCDLGIRKPRREIFEEALKRLNIKPEEAIYVGDIEWTDIEGSKALGMKAVLYVKDKDNVETKADFVINDLRELINIVKQLEEKT